MSTKADTVDGRRAPKDWQRAFGMPGRASAILLFLVAFVRLGP